MKNYFAILGVHRRSTVAELRDARKARAMDCHPDRGGDAAEMEELNEAFEALTRGRRVYDILLESKMECACCKGEGRLRRQRGFKGAVYTVCPGCGGAGRVWEE